MQVLESVLPALNLAKAGATGLGIPGVEPVINGVLELATMVSVCDSTSCAKVLLMPSRQCIRTKMIYPS
jgi:hypothetical protein